MYSKKKAYILPLPLLCSVAYSAVLWEKPQKIAEFCARIRHELARATTEPNPSPRSKKLVYWQRSQKQICHEHFRRLNFPAKRLRNKVILAQQSYRVVRGPNPEIIRGLPLNKSQKSICG